MTTGNRDFQREISLLIRSRYGLIWLRTPERDRTESLVWHVAESLGMDLFTWAPGAGMRRQGASDPMYGTSDPETAIAQSQSSEKPAIYCFHGFGPSLGDREIRAKFEEAVCSFTRP